MTTLAVINVLLCVLIAVLYCIQKRTARWQLVLPAITFLFTPTIHILAQWRRVPMPTLRKWIVRVVVCGAAMVALLVCGNLDLLDTKTTRKFKAQAMLLFSEHTMGVEGTSISVQDRLTIEIPSFGRTACVVATLAVLYGVVFFRWPYEMMFVLAVIGLLAGLVLDFWITGSSIDEIAVTGNLNEVAQSYAYVTGVVCILATIHWLTFAFAAWLGYNAGRESAQPDS